MENRIHQGESLRILLISSSIKMEWLAETLGMTRQNLNKHLGKPVLSKVFTDTFGRVFKIDISKLFDYGIEDAKKTWNKYYMLAVVQKVNRFQDYKEKGQKMPEEKPGNINNFIEKTNDVLAETSQPNEPNDVNEMLVTSLEPINQGGNDMNTLQSMQRTQENYSIAEKNRSEAAKDTAKTQLILAELLQMRFGEEITKKASGM